MRTTPTLPAYVQTSLADIDVPLAQLTFTVVDLETTGGRPGVDAITEFGAVRVCGGQAQGEFQSLVNPRAPISPYVSVLTGITDAMVANAPSVGEVLLSFLEFARGSILVAHNAPFDVGFMRAAAQTLDISWPNFTVVDTVVLARRILGREEVPNCKLSTLAAYFRAPTVPSHRALDDARATVDVLHGLLARLGNVGVSTLPELQEFSHRVSEQQRRKRHLADSVAASPGVYIFRDEKNEALYVGTSRNMRSRVRQYFLASEKRRRMGEMVGLAHHVEAIECAHALEAQVRELRIIAAQKPRYNRRSKHPERQVWLKLTNEIYPRLSIVRQIHDDGAHYLGPLRTQHQAACVRDAIHEAVPLRQCTDRLSLCRIARPACALAEIDRCAAPCEHRIGVADYESLCDSITQAWKGNTEALTTPLQRRIESLAAAQRFEQAAVVRDRMTAVLRACARMQRLRSITQIAHLVAASPDGGGGWDLATVAHGRLVAAGHAPRGKPPWEVITHMLEHAEVIAPHPVEPAALAEETECLLRWLEQPHTRLVLTATPWSTPARSAQRLTWAMRHSASSVEDTWARDSRIGA